MAIEMGLLNYLSKFYNFSGLKINEENTRAKWIVEKSNLNYKLCKDYKLDWTLGPVKILGVTFTTMSMLYWF